MNGVNSNKFLWRYTMKKRKWDIILVIIIILFMGLIFLGNQMGQKDGSSDKQPIKVWLNSTVG